MNEIRKFYKLQSFEYDPEPESISWYMDDFANSENVMKQDIYYVWKDDSEFYRTKVIELAGGKSIIRVWHEFLDKGYMSLLSQELICLDDLEYSLDYAKTISTIEEWSWRGYYILAFEGKIVDRSPWGGNCVRLVKVINKIFLWRLVEIKEAFADRGYLFDLLEITDSEEFILNASDHDIERMCDELDNLDPDSLDLMYDETTKN